MRCSKTQYIEDAVSIDHDLDDEVLQKIGCDVRVDSQQISVQGFCFPRFATLRNVQCDRRHVSLRECRNHLCYLVSLWVESGKYDVSVPVKLKEIGMIAPMMDSRQYFGFPNACFISRFRVSFLGVKTHLQNPVIWKSHDDSN